MSILHMIAQTQLIWRTVLSLCTYMYFPLLFQKGIYIQQLRLFSVKYIQKLFLQTSIDYKIHGRQKESTSPLCKKFFQNPVLPFT